MDVSFWKDQIPLRFIQIVEKVVEPSEECDYEELKKDFVAVTLSDRKTLVEFFLHVHKQKRIKGETKFKICEIAQRFFHNYQNPRIGNTEKNNLTNEYVEEFYYIDNWKGILLEYYRFIDGDIEELFRFVDNIEMGFDFNKEYCKAVWKSFIECYINSKNPDIHNLDSTETKHILKEMCRKLTDLFTKEAFLTNFVNVFFQHAFFGFQNDASHFINTMALQYKENPAVNPDVFSFIAEFPDYVDEELLLTFFVQLPFVYVDTDGNETYYLNGIQVSSFIPFITVNTFIYEKLNKVIIDESTENYLNIIEKYGVGITEEFISALYQNPVVLNEVDPLHIKINEKDPEDRLMQQEFSLKMDNEVDKSLLTLNTDEMERPVMPSVPVDSVIPKREKSLSTSSKKSKQKIFFNTPAPKKNSGKIPEASSPKKNVDVKEIKNTKPCKTLLQENVAKLKGKYHYSKPSEKTAPFSIMVTVTCKEGGKARSSSALGIGQTQKEAEENAAQNWLDGKFITPSTKPKIKKKEIALTKEKVTSEVAPILQSPTSKSKWYEVNAPTIPSISQISQVLHKSKPASNKSSTNKLEKRIAAPVSLSGDSINETNQGKALSKNNDMKSTLSSEAEDKEKESQDIQNKSDSQKAHSSSNKRKEPMESSSINNLNLGNPRMKGSKNNDKRSKLTLRDESNKDSNAPDGKVNALVVKDKKDKSQNAKSLSRKAITLESVKLQRNVNHGGGFIESLKPGYLKNMTSIFRPISRAYTCMSSVIMDRGTLHFQEAMMSNPLFIHKDIRSENTIEAVFAQVYNSQTCVYILHQNGELLMKQLRKLEDVRGYLSYRVQRLKEELKIDVTEQGIKKSSEGETFVDEIRKGAENLARVEVCFKYISIMLEQPDNQTNPGQIIPADLIRIPYDPEVKFIRISAFPGTTRFDLHHMGGKVTEMKIAEITQEIHILRQEKKRLKALKQNVNTL